MFLAGTMFSLCSCVDTNYDLANKEISTDVEIKGNKLIFPLGSLQAFVIDSLVKDIELIDISENGVYCIQRNDKVYLEKDLFPIELNIPSQNISYETGTPSSNFGQVIKELPIGEFKIEKNISFRNKVYKQFAHIYDCSFKKDLAIVLNLKLDGLDGIKAKSANLNFTIDFPVFFKELKSEDKGVTTEGNQVSINKEYLASNDEGLNIKLHCAGFDFGEEGLKIETDEKGHAYLSHQSIVTAKGKITLRNEDSGLRLSGTQVAMNMNFDFEDVSVKVVNGLFYEDFHGVDSVFAIDLGDLAETLEEASNHIRLAAPYLEVVLNSDINVPLEEVELCMYGKDEEGKIIDDTKFQSSFELIQQEDETSEEIIPTITHLLFTSSEDLHKEGFEKILMPNLAMWLEQVPDSMGFSVRPILAAKRKNIRIDRKISLNAACKTVIPLSFEKLHLTYNNTVPVSIEEDSLEMFNNAGLKLKMSVASTLPLGLSLKTTALDENENPIEDITFGTIDIEPCNEEHSTLQTTKNIKNVEISIHSKGLDFSNLKHLQFDIEVYTDGNNIAEFKPTQGIKLSNIAIEISGDIISNLNE